MTAFDYQATPFSYVLLKVAAACNLKCPYCYWFRDISVYKKPRIMSVLIEDFFIEKLNEHLQNHSIKTFKVLIHGGEPTLIGKKRFDLLCEKIYAVSQSTGVDIQISMTTNGVLIDEEWALILKQHKVSIALSLDGPENVHNKNRINFGNKGTWDKTMKALNILKKHELPVGVLAVADLETDPVEIIDFFIKEAITSFDLLIPDENYDSKEVPRINEYYVKAFKHWYANYSDKASFRLFENVIRGLLGKQSKTEGIGIGPISFLTINSDGTLETLDTLRIRGCGSNQTKLNVVNNQFEDLKEEEDWKFVLKSSLDLPPKCMKCQFQLVCGGGYITHRWSSQNDFNNPSVYCEDLIEIISSVWQTISKDLVLQA